MRIGSRREDDFEINVISLIVVLLTLLMFFVLSTTFVEHSRLKVNLPKADTQARESTDNALTLVVAREDGVLRRWNADDASAFQQVRRGKREKKSDRERISPGPSSSQAAL